MHPTSPRPSRPRPTVRRPLAVAVLAALAVTASCSSDGSDDAVGRTTTSAPARSTTTVPGDGSETKGGGDPSTANRLAAACNAALDGRSAEVTQAGRDAGVASLAAALQGDLGDQAARTAWVDALDAHRAELEAVRDELGAVEVPDALADDWAAVTAVGDAEIDRLRARATAVASGDAGAVRSSRPDSTRGSADRLERALVAVGVGRSDCETAFTGLGTPADDAEFVVAAADACTDVASRRRRIGFEDRQGVVLEAVADVLQDGTVPTADRKAAAEAVDDVLAEWRATVDDLGSIDAESAPDPKAWEQVVAVAEDRVDAFERRRQALADGDDDAIAEAFQPAKAFRYPGFDGFDELGLADRDCRAMGS